MNLIEKLISDNKETIINSIFDEELKGKVCKAINDNVDIPFIGESTEAKIIDALYSSVEDVVKETILQKL
tara:strand:- start:461 stop:670 length:210 start_codon:yes stop_codon:yes gene_type:complete